ncbi:MAG: hypothetical protein WCG27_11785 [Pseudomonadota bacterium]
MKFFTFLIVSTLFMLLSSCSKRGQIPIYRPVPGKDRVITMTDGTSIPQWRVTQAPEIKLGMEFLDTKSVAQSITMKDEGATETAQSHLRQKSLHATYKILNHQDIEESDIIKHGEEDIYVISNWRDQSYYPFLKELMELKKNKNTQDFSGIYDVNFNLAISSTAGISKISGIKFSILLYNQEKKDFYPLGLNRLTKNSDDEEVFVLENNKEINPAIGYRLLAKGISPQYLLRELPSRGQLALKLIDMEVETRTGVSYKFSDWRRENERFKSRVIYSDPWQTTVYYISSGETLKDFILTLDQKAEFDGEGNVVKIHSFRGGKLGPSDWKNISMAEAAQEGWATIGKGKEVLLPGKTYLITYASINDIALSQVQQQIIGEKQIVEKEVAFDEVKAGDVLEFEILQAQRSTPEFKEAVTGQECGYDGQAARNNGGGGGRGDRTYGGVVGNTFEWNKWCRVKELLFAKYSIEDINFSDSHSVPRLRIKVGEKIVALDSALVPGNKMFVSNDGKILKWRFIVNKQMLGNQNRLSLVVLPDPQASMVNLGFRSWDDCEARNHAGFKFRGYSTAPRPMLNEKLERYQVSLSRWGTTR